MDIPTSRNHIAEIKIGRPIEAADISIYEHIVNAIVDHPTDGQGLMRPDPTLADDPTARLTIARINGVPAGIVVTRRGGASGRHAGSLESLAILPEYRGLGLARQLVQIAVDDREAVDGAPTPLWAAIRAYPDGRINIGSGRALRHAGFQIVSEGRFDPKASTRAAHYVRTTDADGMAKYLMLVRARFRSLEAFRL